MGEVWLVRHAPTALSGVCYGQSDVPVTVEPIDAARAIIQRWDELRRGDTPGGETVAQLRARVEAWLDQRIYDGRVGGVPKADQRGLGVARRSSSVGHGAAQRAGAR